MAVEMSRVRSGKILAVVFLLLFIGFMAWMFKAPISSRWSDQPIETVTQIIEATIEEDKTGDNYNIIPEPDGRQTIEVFSATAEKISSGGGGAATLSGVSPGGSTTTKLGYVSDEFITTQVFAIDNIEVESAEIILPKKPGSKVNTVVYCENFDIESFTCPSWQPTGIPFTDNEDSITFEVTHFSGYAGAFYDNNQTGFDAGTYNWTDYDGTSLKLSGELPDSAVNSEVDMTGNVLLMHLNEPSANGAPGGTDIEDFSGGGYHGTESGGVTFNAAGKLNTAIGFDGSNDYVSLGDNLDQTTNDFSISAWIKTSSTANYQAIVSKRISSPPAYDGYRLWLYQSCGVGVPGMILNDADTVSDTLICAQNTVNDGNWHYLVATFDRNVNGSIYIDGVLDGTGSITVQSASLSNSGNFRIGQGSVSNYPFNGSIDEVAIFSRILSAAEINTTYNAQKEDHPGSGDYLSQVFDANQNVTWNNIAWLSNVGEMPDNQQVDPAINMTGNVLLMHLNEGSGTGIADTSGTSNTGTYNGALHAQSGKFDTAIGFDASNDYITMGDQASLDFGTGDFTVAAWIKLAPNSANTPIFGNRPQGNAGAVAGWYVSVLDSGKPYIQIEDNGGDFATVSADSTVDDSQWHHLVYVFDRSGNGEIFIDGVSDKTGSIASQSNTITNTHTKDIRRGYGTSSAFYGDAITIDELAVFNRILSDSEVMDLYNRGTLTLNISVHDCNDAACSGEESTWDETCTQTPCTVSDTVSADNYFQYKADFATDNTTYTPELYNLTVNYNFPNYVPVIENITLNSTLGTNLTSENLTVYWDASDANSDAIKNITNWYKDGTSIAVLNMPFENNGSDAGTTDYSGNGNDGTEAGSIVWSSTVGYDGFGAYYFDGSNDYIEIPSSSDFSSTNSTWCLWVNTSGGFGAGTGTTISTLIGRHSIPGSLSGVNLRMLPDGTISWQAKDALNNRPFDINSSTGYNDGQWHHVCGVASAPGGTAELYVDGVLVDSDSTVTPSWAFGGYVVRMGDSADAYWGQFKGHIDEVQIYNNPLSAEQIIALNNSRTDLIVSQETSIGDVWQACLTPNDGGGDGSTACSNNLTVLLEQLPPVAGNVTLNSTLGTNRTSENLTVYFDVSDDNNDAIKNITNWYRNGTSITVLNMPFEGNLIAEGGTKVKDYTPYGNNGTVTNAKWNSIGGYDGWGNYYFDGSGDNIVAANDASLNFGTSPMSADFFIKTNYSNLTARTILHKYDDNAGYGYLIYTHSGKIIFYPYYGLDTVSTTGNISDNQWHHVAVTRDGTTTKVYIDGVLNKSETLTVYDSDNAVNLEIGDDYGQNLDYLGYLDDVRIYNHSLSAEQIIALNNSRTDLIVSQETSAGDTWKACITPNDGEDDGSTACSNNLTISSGLQPTYTKFSSYSETTDFSAVSNLNSITNAVLAIDSYGKINWTGAINADNQDYDVHINIGGSYVSMNSSALDDSHNSSAIVSLYGIDCSNFNLFYQPGHYSTAANIITGGTLVANQDNIGGNCKDAAICTNVACSGTTLSFTAQHFSGYAGESSTNLTIWDETESDGSQYSGLTKYPGNLTMFFANYTNATGGLEIGSTASCNISYNIAPNGPTPMEWNSTKNLFEHNRTFAFAGTYDWNVTCSHPDFATLTALDNVYITTVLSATVAIPEFSDFTLILALVLVLGGFVAVRKQNS